MRKHLELLVHDEDTALEGIQHAGGFVQPMEPEPIATTWQAQVTPCRLQAVRPLWSGIGAELFIKRTSIIRLDEQHFRRLARSVTLARGEGF